MNHGTDLGAVTYQPGIKGQAAAFNGTTDTLDLGNAPALSQSLSNFSVMGWFKLDKDLGSEDVNHMLLSNRDGSQSGFAIQLEDGTTPSQTGRLRVACYNGGSNESLVATGHHYFSDRDHHHVVFTLEGGIGRLYVDGLQVASKTIVEPGDSGNSLYLGSHLGSSAHWVGAMDEVTFYRRGLQAEEIQSEYLTWAPDSHRQTQPELALTGQWNFDGNYDNPMDPANPAQPSEGLIFDQGMVDQGLVLNGSATVDLGTAADVTLENGTISLWARLDENQLGQNNGRYVLLANHGSDEGFRLIIDNDTDPTQAGSIQWTTYTTTTTTVLSSGATHWPTDDGWHHLAVTKQGTSAKMYLDGVLISTTENLVTPEYINDPLPLFIGATGTGAAYPWAGAMDQLKIYTKSLSPYEILGTYLEGDPVFTDDSSRGAQEEARFILFASDTDPFGLQLREVNDSDLNIPSEPHLFTGQEKEPDLGLYYYNGRWYFPDVGRFLQVDPFREGLSPYLYLGNDPINLVDPTGLVAQDPVNVEPEIEEPPLWRKFLGLFSGKYKWSGKVQKKGEPDVYATNDDIREMADGIPVVDELVGSTIDISEGDYKSASINIGVVIVGGVAYKVLSRGSGLFKIVGPAKGFGDDKFDVSRTVSKRNRKHIRNRHLADFQELDPDISTDTIINIGLNIARNKRNLVKATKDKFEFDEVIGIGGKSVKVRAVLNKNKSLRSVHIRD